MSDTTEIYVKMCDRPEVQDQFPTIQFGDAVACRGVSVHDVVRWRGLDGWDEVFDIDRNLYIVIPRQDQIQGWLEDYFAGIHNLLQNFGLWISANYSPVDTPFWASQEYLKKFSSAEQLWLAFYMHEKHGLTWTGERWE